jgi:membrane protein implicated in regulation of membrane protease activity
MQGIRSFFIAASGIALLALAALFTASLTVAFIGVLAVLSVARLLSARLKPAPIPVKRRNQREMRVWNDGKGTIIDL